MRFASAGDYISAGHSAAASGLGAIIAARKNSPNFQGIAEQGQQEEPNDYAWFSQEDHCVYCGLH